jgi:bacteriocin biosynthesis cyclodehydratase domain-containing protein
MPPPELATIPIHVLSVGAFGSAVVRHLASFCPNLRETRWNVSFQMDAETWPAAALQVLVSHNPVPSICEFLGALSYARSSPFIPLIIDASALCLGPIIVPGRSACWRCWAMRSQQHAKSPRQRSALLEFYDSHPNAAAKRYLESFAMMGAIQIASSVNELEDSSQPGRIWQMNLFSRQIRTGRLIGVDGCTSCGLGRPLDSRTYAEAREKLAYLWENELNYLFKG